MPGVRRCGVRRLCVAAVVVVLLMGAGAHVRAQETTALSADGSGVTALALEPAPIFLLPDASRQPLRVAREGSRLRVVSSSGEWVTVQFQDPQFGLRTGSIQRRFVRIDQPADMQPMDLSIPLPAVPVPPVPQPDRSSEPAAPRAARPRARVRVEPEAARGISTSEGFYLGIGLEGDGLLSTEGGINSTTESGRGFGVGVGYGFTRRASLYFAVSGARMDSLDFVGTYALAHVDLGTRVHFRSGAGRVVPFVQAGLSGRGIGATLYSGLRAYEVSAGGAGVSFGGGLNAHVNPSLAFSGHVMWTVGSFSRYEVNGVPLGGDASSATSARVHLGLVWFPHGGSRRP